MEGPTNGSWWPVTGSYKSKSSHERADEKTLNPSFSPQPDLRQSGGKYPKQVVLEVVFHSDFRHIGSLCVVGSSHIDQAISVGRNLPLEVPTLPGWAPAPPITIDDPCISREQLSLRWSASKKTFHASDLSGQGWRILDARGCALTSYDEFPSGSILSIRDRVLLLCTTRPIEDESNLGLVGQSEIMADLRERIRRMARVMEAVLIRGEPGTGKELIARAIHDASERRNNPYVPVNCAALPENLVEAELFGHARGAYTGAGPAKDGLFACARGGTIFLDEIGDMPMVAQTKLLRVLQEGKIRPVGATSEISVDARVVAATNRNLKADVASGRFRADLLTRLAGLEIEAPTLRARRLDIPFLFATFFLKRANVSQRLHRFIRDANEYAPPIPLDVVLSWLAYDWPGNVRELERHVAATEIANDDEGPFVAPPLSSSLPTRPSTEEPTTNSRQAATSSTANGGDVTEPPKPSSRSGKQQKRPDASELERLFDEHDFIAQRVADALGSTRTTVVRWAKELHIVLPEDLPRSAIEEALRVAKGDLVKAARILRVGLRGLKLKMKDLGL